jgi:hypothetical protein
MTAIVIVILCTLYFCVGLGVGFETFGAQLDKDRPGLKLSLNILLVGLVWPMWIAIRIGTKLQRF